MLDFNKGALMYNLLILYNPYYQQEVVEKHVDILKRASDPLRARVAFGKVRSKLRDYDHPHEEKLQKVYASASDEKPLQLFLTDYADMYVARVVEVTTADRSDIAPDYYAKEGLDVERWFVLSDIRRIVQDDFRFIRDRVLSNFTTPNFHHRHYAIYGNSYVYPLLIEMDDPIDYFSYDFPNRRYFQEIFENDRAREVRNHLIHYRFGETLFYGMHPNAQDGVVGAEIEFTEHRNDPLHDFSAVVIKYAKAYEWELWRFGKRLFAYLGENKNLSAITYQVQGREYTMADYQLHKPNVGTTKYLLGNPLVRDAIEGYVPNGPLKAFVKWGLRQGLEGLPEIRNDAAHEEKISLAAAREVRQRVVGIGENGLLADLVKYRMMIGNNR
jgi:hypothetical protein